MNLDFRKLSQTNKVKAINETIRQNDVDWLSYIITASSFDVYGWFNLEKSVDGSEYWFKIVDEQKNDK